MSGLLDELDNDQGERSNEAERDAERKRMFAQQYKSSFRRVVPVLKEEAAAPVLADESAQAAEDDDASSHGSNAETNNASSSPSPTRSRQLSSTSGAPESLPTLATQPRRRSILDFNAIDFPVVECARVEEASPPRPDDDDAAQQLASVRDVNSRVLIAAVEERLHRIQGIAMGHQREMVENGDRVPSPPVTSDRELSLVLRNLRRTVNRLLAVVEEEDMDEPRPPVSPSGREEEWATLDQELGYVRAESRRLEELGSSLSKQKAAAEDAVRRTEEGFARLQLQRQVVSEKWSALEEARTQLEEERSSFEQRREAFESAEKELREREQAARQEWADLDAERRAFEQEKRFLGENKQALDKREQALATREADVQSKLDAAPAMERGRSARGHNRSPRSATGPVSAFGEGQAQAANEARSRMAFMVDAAVRRQHALEAQTRQRLAQADEAVREARQAMRRYEADSRRVALEKEAAVVAARVEAEEALHAEWKEAWERIRQREADLETRERALLQQQRRGTVRLASSPLKGGAQEMRGMGGEERLMREDCFRPMRPPPAAARCGGDNALQDSHSPLHQPSLRAPLSQYSAPSRGQEVIARRLRELSSRYLPKEPVSSLSPPGWRRR